MLLGNACTGYMIEVYHEPPADELLNPLQAIQPAPALTNLSWLTACRLWVTAEPHPQFPIGLLQMGIKITNEAPVGMKAGLRASYQWVNQDMLDVVSRWVAWPVQLVFSHAT